MIMKKITTTTHPWHISIGDKAPEIIQVVIEIPKDSRMKYELDKGTGLLKLDRVLYSAVHYPMNYGLIPQTYFEDDDPLDVLVMCSLNREPLCMLEARVIGMMHMEDEKGLDDKVITVAHRDPAYLHINSVEDLPEHTIEELKNFFEYYKILENKKVKVGEMYKKDRAIECIVRSMDLYKKKFNTP
jgi:inorganic pyrophosphatase